MNKIYLVMSMMQNLPCEAKTPYWTFKSNPNVAWIADWMFWVMPLFNNYEDAKKYSEWKYEIKEDVVCDVLIVWLEYYDQTIKKYRYSDSLLIDEVKRPWIIKATENRITKLWEVYYNKV